MSTYVDTNIVLAYAFEEEKQHTDAERMVTEARERGAFYISSFTILELYCVLSRNISKYRLPPIFEEILDSSAKVRGAVKYAVKRLDPIILSDELQVNDIDDIRIFHRFYETIKLAPKIKLTTADSIHVAYAHQLKKEDKIKYFMTADRDFDKKKDLIKENTGILIEYMGSSS